MDYYSAKLKLPYLDTTHINNRQDRLFYLVIQYSMTDCNGVPKSSNFFDIDKDEWYVVRETDITYFNPRILRVSERKQASWLKGSGGKLVVRSEKLSESKINNPNSLFQKNLCEAIMGNYHFDHLRKIDINMICNLIKNKKAKEKMLVEYFKSNILEVK